MTTQSKTIRFESFDAFVEAAKIVPPSANKDRGSRAVGKDDFYGGETFDGAVRLATAGWPEGAKRALELRASLAGCINEIVAARHASFGWEVTGDCVDVGKFLTGEPECWVTTVERGESASGKIVKLVANVAVSAAVSTETLFNRGAVVVAAIDILESLGHRVELTVARGTTVRGKTLQIFVPVKSAAHHLDIDRVAFALCNTAFLRRLAWSVGESHGFIPHETRPAPVEVSHDETLTISEARRSADFTRDQLIEEVKQLCERCGVSVTATK